MQQVLPLPFLQRHGPVEFATAGEAIEELVRKVLDEVEEVLAGLEVDFVDHRQGNQYCCA